MENYYTFSLIFQIFRFPEFQSSKNLLSVDLLMKNNKSSVVSLTFEK